MYFWHILTIFFSGVNANLGVKRHQRRRAFQGRGLKPPRQMEHCIYTCAYLFTFSKQKYDYSLASYVAEITESWTPRIHTVHRHRNAAAAAAAAVSTKASLRMRHHASRHVQVSSPATVERTSRLTTRRETTPFSSQRSFQINAVNNTHMYSMLVSVLTM